MVEARNINIRNKKTSYEYHLLDKYVAGIVLQGSEIKSVREGNVSVSESFCFFDGNELFIKGMNIARYKQASYNNHEPIRDRKLLLNKRELLKLRKGLEEKGLTIVPVRLFVNPRGLAKIEIALAKGKHHFDKRDSIKERDVKREMERGRY